MIYPNFKTGEGQDRMCLLNDLNNFSSFVHQCIQDMLKDRTVWIGYSN